MKIEREPLTVFPTEVAKRHAEHIAVHQKNVLDTSRYSTLKKLEGLCELAARRHGFLTGHQPGDLELKLLLESASNTVSFHSGHPFNRMTSAARAALLRQAIETFSAFAENEAEITEWLLAHENSHKLYGIGQLLRAWRDLCRKKSIADRTAVNAALLRYLRNGPLPTELRHGLILRATRWLNPFEDQLISILKERLGADQVRLFSALPPAHAETAEDRFCSRMRSELMRGAEEEWAPWLEDFADAFEADDSNIPTSESRERISFFISAHPYGEIEDAARRIAAEIESGTAPEQIALILRDLSPYTDIVPDVFQRFDIPFYFRRGIPAASLPEVKTLLALLMFPQNPQRDKLCDLLITPNLEWPGLDTETRQALAKKLRETESPVIKRLPAEIRDIFSPTGRTIPPKQLSEEIKKTTQRHNLTLPEEISEQIDLIGQLTETTVPFARLLNLFTEQLENLTVKDEQSRENGVRVINPLDAAGLRFQSVYLAGMDDQTFPQIPKADPLLNSTERHALRAFLEKRKIRCPRLALSEARSALIQEEILFLTAIGTATERLTLSYTGTDSTGKEHSPGEFFERMLHLSGIPGPDYGESFCTVLPAAFCRAKDEIRQTAAALRRQPKTDKPFPAENVQPLISRWLEQNPELSATALESLARNRFVFFMEKILGINPDRTHEDETDAMDRGSLIHDILDKVYTAIAEQSGLYAKYTDNGWKLSQTGEIPLAVFDPDRKDLLLNLAYEISNKEFRRAEQQSNRHLGHPETWKNEQKKLLKIIQNFIQTDIDTALAENRYPALFELKFDLAHDLLVILTQDEETVQLKGKIDRIDLIFDNNNLLKELLVIDYKGKSRNDSLEILSRKIELNLDCQLPLYTFAAQQKFFDTHGSTEMNEQTKSVYHLQERNLDKMKTHLRRKQLQIDPQLTALFLKNLFINWQKLGSGDLSPKPLIEGFEDYSHICRTPARSERDLF